MDFTLLNMCIGLEIYISSVLRYMLFKLQPQIEEAESTLLFSSKRRCRDAELD